MENTKIISEGNDIVNFGEDVAESYYIKTENGDYRLVITYLGCVDQQTRELDKYYAFGAHIALYCINSSFPDFIDDIFNYCDLCDVFKDETGISGVDYVSLENTEYLKNAVLDCLTA